MRVPFFEIHPCQTNNLLNNLITSQIEKHETQNKNNYLLLWFSIYGKKKRKKKEEKEKEKVKVEFMIFIFHYF